MSFTDPRSTPDNCPGALSTHQAADGALARVRLPGGAITPPQMHILATTAAELGNGSIELTSRGNVQLRAVRDTATFAVRLADIGLLPSPSHERVRNILASPLSGRVDGLTNVRPMVEQLDQALCARPELAQLPGRTLFALDDARLSTRNCHAKFVIQICHNVKNTNACSSVCSLYAFLSVP